MEVVSNGAFVDLLETGYNKTIPTKTKLIHVKLATIDAQPLPDAIDTSGAELVSRASCARE